MQNSPDCNEKPAPSDKLRAREGGFVMEGGWKGTMVTIQFASKL